MSFNSSNEIILKAKSNAEKWLTAGFDSKTKEEVQKLLNGDNAALVSAFTEPMEFGTAGLRGHVGTGIALMNEYTVKAVSFAVARYLKTLNNEPRIALAFDGRADSKHFSEIAAGVFLAAGLKVYYYTEVSPTPLLAFTVRNMKLDFGVMITASHNPPQYNGYKAYTSYGGQIISPTDKTIAEFMNSVEDFSAIACDKLDNHPGLVLLSDNEVNNYLTWVANEVGNNVGRDKLKGVYTALGGSSGALTMKALQFCGFSSIIPVSEEQKPDPAFAGLPAPNPELPSNFNRALDLAQKNDAELVIANDGDGDRLGVYIKNKGNYEFLSGNRLGCLLAWFVLSRLKESNRLIGTELIVSTVVSSPQIRAIAEHFQIHYEETLTGFKWMGAVAEKASNFVFAYEEAFGYCLRGRDKDGISAGALFCEAAVAYRERGGIPALIEEMQQGVGVYLEDAAEQTYTGADGKDTMNKLLEKLRLSPPGDLAGSKVKETRDVLQGEKINAGGRTRDDSLPPQNLIIFKAENGSWLAVRPSGTEPKIKAYFGVRMDYSSFQANPAGAQTMISELKQAANKILTV